MCSCASDTGISNSNGIGSTSQTFRYVATGAEANPFTVTMPTPMPTNNYNVFIQMAGPAANAIKDSRPLVATYTPTTFGVELGGAIQVGDIFQFLVVGQ